MTNEVLKQIDQLYTVMLGKESILDAQLGKLKERKAEAERVERIQIATASSLSARERIIAKYEDFDAEREKFKVVIKRNSSKRVELDKLSAELEKGEKELDKKLEEVETMRDLFRKKNLRNDEMEKQLAVEKKLMREKVLEEIKGKLGQKRL